MSTPLKAVLQASCFPQRGFVLTISRKEPVFLALTSSSFETIAHPLLHVHETLCTRERPAEYASQILRRCPLAEEREKRLVPKQPCSCPGTEEELDVRHRYTSWLF
jgi:hypothetical protein